MISGSSLVVLVAWLLVSAYNTLSYGYSLPMSWLIGGIPAVLSGFWVQSISFDHSPSGYVNVIFEEWFLTFEKHTKTSLSQFKMDNQRKYERLVIVTKGGVIETDFFKRKDGKEKSRLFSLISPQKLNSI
jgi:hypothetical protein